jgi:LemA protein
VAVPWAIWLGVALLAIVIFVAFFQYNRMVTLRNRCTESWSNVDTELQRRYELVPNLVETVKGYAKHEQQLFLNVARTRELARASSNTSASRHGANERHFVAALGRLIAVAEAYPKLQASDQFLKLQHELAITEDRIQAARRFYNANVRDYRNQTQTYPGAFFAKWFNVVTIDFFEIDSPAYRVAPVVNVTGRSA